MAKPMVQTVLTEVRGDYQINNVFFNNEILSKHDKTSIAERTKELDNAQSFSFLKI